MGELRLYQSGSPIAAAWRPLAEHADECDVCLPLVARLVGALNPRHSDFEVYDELCEAGQALFTPWRTAKDEWLEATREHRRQRFITDEQLVADGVSFEVRAEAVMSMPHDEYRAWLLLPDHRRHAQLRAVESGLRDYSADNIGEKVTLRRCEGCGRENHTHGRFHSRACRQKWEAEHG